MSPPVVCACRASRTNAAVLVRYRRRTAQLFWHSVWRLLGLRVRLLIGLRVVALVAGLCVALLGGLRVALFGGLRVALTCRCLRRTRRLCWRRRFPANRNG